MTRQPTHFFHFATATALTLTAAGLLFAGPLNPPAGPITSTNKTLQEVEPRIAINLTNTPGDADSLFKITQPGSYYLTGNITGVVGKHGIEIAASGVTLDLMGFDLSGIPAMGAFDGVSATIFNLTNITVRNGSVRGWGDEGVDLGSNVAINSAIIDVRASDNTGFGIAIGSYSTITGCTATRNTSGGIFGQFNCTITACMVSFNTGNGVATGQGSTITGCTTSRNTGNGILTGDGCTITGCTAQVNTLNGIAAGNGNTITGCTASYNTASGITTNGSMIAGCTTAYNTNNGIRVESGCVVLANTCFSNGSGSGVGAGILAAGSDNRIEGNNCTGADRGIDVDGAGNIIIKNTCSGNTTANWDIVANNVVGPILDRAAPASASILGNSAPSSLGTTDPNANFTY